MGLLRPLGAGFVLGFLIALQVGPVWLLCARTVLRGRAVSGLAIGLGAATVDLAYGWLGLVGAAALLQVTPLRVGLGLAGAAVLAGLGCRALWTALRVRAGVEAPAEVAGPLAAYRTGLAATAANPITIAYWAAAFSAASAAHLATSAAARGLLLAGIVTGSAAWYVILTAVTVLVRRRVGERAMRLADVLAGGGLVAFGGLVAVHAVEGR